MSAHLPPTPSDEDLACRAQGGCAASLEQLLRRFQVPVLHFLRQRGAGDDAEDLTQETFLRAFVHLHRYRPRWRFATWIFTIARRVSINHHRRERPMSGGVVLSATVSAVPGPFQAALVEEGRQYLWTKVSEVLSEDETTALWLHYVEEMPVRQIAVVLDRSWVATKTMMFRARKKLLPVLRDLAPEGNERETTRRLCFSITE